MKLLTSDTLSKAIDEIIGKAREQDSIDPVFVIVPDRLTLYAERMVSEGVCLLNTNVITFTKLFYLLQDELGDDAVVLDKTSAVLLMWRAIKNVRDRFIWFTGTHYSFAEKMFNTVNQLTSSMVDFDRLVDNTKTSVTQKKMHDIVMIYKEYKRLVGEGTDSSGQLKYLIENINRSQHFSQSEFFVVGFDNISPERLMVLKEIKKIANMTVGARQESEFEWGFASG